MTATIKTTAPVFKPRDIVTTPGGRMAKVKELLPAGERRVEFLDAAGGIADFKTCHLTLVHEAQFKAWKDHTL